MSKKKEKPEADELRLEYEALDELLAWPRNPKDHDIGELHQSMDRFGFTTPVVVDETTGYLGEGVGRLETLHQKMMGNLDRPKNIKVRDDGMWLLPVIRGNHFENEDELAAFIIGANMLVTAGGWDDPMLKLVMADLHASLGDKAFIGTAFDTDYLAELSSRLDPLPLGSIVDDEGEFEGAPEGFVIQFVVMDPDARDEIVADLQSRGFEPEVKIRR